MDHLAPPIKKEYDRWILQVGEDDPCAGETTIGLYDVLRAHFLIADYFYCADDGIGGVGPRDLGLLESAVYRQFAGFGNTIKWTNKFDQCATLFYGLIKNHSFYDANKRTAFLTCLYHMQKIGRCSNAPQKEFEELTIRIADNSLNKYRRYKKLVKKRHNPEILFISDFLKRKTRNIDKRFYSITYNQLKTIIHRYGFGLQNPHGNTIDITKEVKEKTFFGFGKQRIKIQKIGQIGFPGWKSQVGKGAINTVRKVTGLVPEKGYDSQAFFKGADPMQSLLDQYKGPLQRLADK